MIKIELGKEFSPHLNGTPLQGQMNLYNDRINWLQGENGIGKSSFIHALMRYQDSILNGQKVCFTQQKRLESINTISAVEMLSGLVTLKEFQENQFFLGMKELCLSFLNKPINDLSGGQNQMFKILISSLRQADLFIFDEPFQYLDKKFRKVLTDYFYYLMQENKIILLVEHQSVKIQGYDLNIIQMEYKEDFIWIG